MSAGVSDVSSGVDIPLAVVVSSVALYAITLLSALWLWYKGSIETDMESHRSSKSMFLYTVIIGTAVRCVSSAMPLPHNFVYTILNRAALLAFIAAFSFIVFNWTTAISLDLPRERASARNLRKILITSNILVFGGTLGVLVWFGIEQDFNAEERAFTGTLYDSTILFIVGAQLLLAGLYLYYGRKLVNIVWVATKQLPVHKSTATPYVKYLSFVSTCVACFVLRFALFSFHFLTGEYLNNVFFFYAAILVPDISPIWMQLWFFRNRILMFQENTARNVSVAADRELSFDHDDWDTQSTSRADRDSSLLLETHGGGSSLTHSLISPKFNASSSLQSDNFIV